MVFVETNEFKPADPQYYNSRVIRLPVATADTSRLVKAAISALGVIWRPGFRYKKAGTVFLELGPAGRVQGGCSIGPTTPGHLHACARSTR